MDTRTFHDPEEYKKQAQKHWMSAPRGSNYSAKELMSSEFFEEVERHRYCTHPWILENIKRFDLKGKKVLEIGFGMGTDHLSLAKQGGIMHGVDLTPRNLEIIRKRFEIYGLKSELLVSDAENLPYDDNLFDVVYSFGVIHHSPDTQRVISEIHRVLKPGGKCWITVYHKNSIFFWWSVFLIDWVFKGGFRRESLKGRLSRIEYPNDNPNIVVHLYTRKKFAAMFSIAGFHKIQSSINHLIADDIASLGKYIPRKILERLAKKFGWYVIIEAVK
ncbi:MAG: Methyltransferase domain [Candidatus Jettenia ecosi]|uniref:Methyltransferase domain n=1 Tax=Candidatus Jettenia ecosi TaxID=2494326 RepID=A0A533QAU3_9BACT|nr:MAG: Methyltransferase domain [Candidatus Jettenia ecosi]